MRIDSPRHLRAKIPPTDSLLKAALSEVTGVSKPQKIFVALQLSILGVFRVRLLSVTWASSMMPTFDALGLSLSDKKSHGPLLTVQGL